MKRINRFCVVQGNLIWIAININRIESIPFILDNFYSIFLISIRDEIDN